MPRWANIALTIVSIVVTVAGIATYVIKNRQMGTKFVVSAKESVNYSGESTEADARLLADALKQGGYFDGTDSADVLLWKGADGMTVSFVVKEGKWDDAEVVKGFTFLGERCAAAFDVKPFKVSLLSTSLNTKKELPITQRRHWASDKEQVVFTDPITLAQAQALAEALKKAGYFDGSAPAVVRLAKGDKGHVLGFVVGEGAWDKPNVVTELEGTGRKVADAIGKPLAVEFLDSDMVSKKTIPLE